MSTKGDAKAGGRVITKVVITYHTEDDPQERTLTMEHGARGQVVDAIVWGEELIKKLAYLEDGKCVEPKKGPGTGDWKVYAAEPAARKSIEQTSAMQKTSAAQSEQINCVW